MHFRRFCGSQRLLHIKRLPEFFRQLQVCRADAQAFSKISQAFFCSCMHKLLPFHGLANSNEKSDVGNSLARSPLLLNAGSPFPPL